MAILKPEELKEKFDDPWIAPYEKVITMADGDIVELIEYHPCPSGSNWLLYQYQHSSELIIDAKRDGNKHTYLTTHAQAVLTGCFINTNTAVNLSLMLKEMETSTPTSVKWAKNQ